MKTKEDGAPYTLVNPRTHQEKAKKYKTLAGALRGFYAAGGRAKGWRIEDRHSHRVGP